MKKSLFVIVLLMGALLPGVNAQTPNYWVEIDIGEKYLYLGDRIEITARTNASTIRVLIVDPEGSFIYNQVWSANETRSLPTVEGSAYGTYRIVGKVEDILSEKRITLIDETGFSSASFPVTKAIHNVEYTVFSNWTLKGVNPDLGEMWIDFTALRNIVSIYDMNVDSYVNPTSFLLRMSKGAYAVDLRLIQVHDGLKLKINGTLSGATKFPIRFPKAERWVKDVLRSGNYFVDYSDLSGFEWDGTNINGTVFGTFDYDPTIYTSGYESGGFVSDGWTGIVTNGASTIGVGVDWVFNGTYSANSTIGAWSNYAYWYKDINADEGYFRTVANFTQFMNLAERYISYIRVRKTVGYVYFLQLAIENDYGVYQWQIRFQNDTLGGIQLVTLTGNNPIANTVYDLQVKVKLGNGDGEIRFWIDGNQVYNITGIVNDGVGNFTQVQIGQHCTNGPSTGILAYFDDFVYSSTLFGGPVSTYYLIANSLILSTFVGGYNSTVSMNLETNSTPGWYWFGHNIQDGYWENTTARVWLLNGTVSDWFWIPAKYGLAFDVQGYANSTDVNNATTIHSFVIVAPAFGGGGGAIGIIMLCLIFIPALFLLGVRKG